MVISNMPFRVSIFADGPPCSKALSQRLRKGRFALVLDGAAESARKQGWLPNLICGDFDSVTPATLRHFARRGVEILATPDQNYTDLEKALAWCALRDASSVWIAQSLGARTDHTFSALALLRRFHDPARELVVFHEKERIRFLRDEKVRLGGKRQRRIALLPFARCLARTRGLAFEMEGAKLELGVNESVSNRARGSRVEIEVEGDALLVEETE
ncbi:MAG: thiamine diphosphokinase [Bdellovibrionota bacterium]